MRFCFTHGGHNPLVGIGVSLLLIALGLVLAVAVHRDPNAAVNVHAVGWILLAVGVVGLLLSLLLWERWGPGTWSRRRRAYAGPPGDTYARRPYRSGRRTVVEEEEGPAGDPYGAPPPP
jgi:Domain of unknown function (DUF6458)